MRSMMLPVDDGTLLHVGVTGEGPDAVMLSGGPGCVHYLEDDALAPRGMRAWYPNPEVWGALTVGRTTLLKLYPILKQCDVPKVLTAGL